MTREEELELCLKMGVREDWAEDLLKTLSGINGSALPVLRLLRSFTDHLHYYEGKYAERLKQAVADGCIIPSPEKNLINRGAAPEEIQDLALYHISETIDWVMELLVCRTCESELFKDEAFSECGSVGIVELGPDRRPTGKYVIYPTAADYERWFKKDE